MILSLVKKSGLPKFIFGLTVISIAYSVIITSISLLIFQGYIDVLSIALFIAAPAIFLPVPAYFCFNTMLKLDLTESRLAKNNMNLEKALYEIKKLSGLLPIYANCKKIRDSSGLWNEIEVYVRDNSEAEFSHSLCPTCTEKLYPGFFISTKK